MKKLEPHIRVEHDLFNMSVKRSLQSHVAERKQREEQEIENIMRKQKEMVIEERSDRLRKLREIQQRYNIQLRTKVNESGEEIICVDIPFDQKVRNECNDYHYFFHYKKERAPILKERDKMSMQFESGHSARVLEEFEAAEVKWRAEAERELKR